MNTEQCSQLSGDLSAYLAGETSEELCREIEHHLEDCEDCQVVVDTLRKTVELVRGLPPPDLPEDSRERLYIALDLTDQLGPQSE